MPTAFRTSIDRLRRSAPLNFVLPYRRGSSTLSSAVVRERRLKPWNTKPIFLLRTAASASLDIRATSAPSRKYCPDVGRSRQPVMCMNVDLPDPDGPVTARNSPRATSRLTPRSALTSISPTTYVLTRFLTEMTVDVSIADLNGAAIGGEGLGLKAQGLEPM